MKKHKFFRFTISGDDLNLQDITSKVNLPSKIYEKDTAISKLGKTIVQKTNRWLFYDEQMGESSVTQFLTKNLLIIYQHFEELKYFINKYKAYIELVVYADNKTDLSLSKRQIDLLNKIGVKFYISFC